MVFVVALFNHLESPEGLVTPLTTRGHLNSCIFMGISEFVVKGRECEAAVRAGLGLARILDFSQVLNPRTGHCKTI